LLWLAVVNSGGLEFVSSGGIVSGASLSGGTLELAGGEVDSSPPINFVGAGGLVLDAAELFSGTVAGFGSASRLDTIDLRDIPYTSGTTSGELLGRRVERHAHRQ
jgi:autotransporter passenger strand-loop-strand repeat protein